MKAHDISHYQVGCWSHASRVTNDEALSKNVCQSATETGCRRKDRKTKAIAKLFELHINTIKQTFKKHSV